MDDILNNFKNLKLDNKNICILCHNYYDKSLFYNNNDVLCYNCNKKYEEYIYDDYEDISNNDGSIIF